MEQIKTPAYVIDEKKLISNLELLKQIQEETGCRILLAQKAFSCYPLYPLMGKYLAGTAASGLFEGKLGKEEMQKESHMYSPAYRQEEFEDILAVSDHIVFNSFSQVQKFGRTAREAGKSIGLRINPEFSTQPEHEIYDPCAKMSRLGTTKSQWEKEGTKELISLLDGIHFHTLCEQNSDDLWDTILAVEEKFGDALLQMKWINLGGGHHITRDDYDVEKLKESIRYLQKKYGLLVYLEPGEAVALNAGELICSVLDIVENEGKIAILDTSAACHMPDVLEMPYRPRITGSKEAGELPYTYRLGGPTCLAGDIIGDYSFEKELSVGDTLMFEDMAIYSMVKNNTFNGMPLPSIVLKTKEGNCQILKTFSYEDFKCRLG